MTNVGRYLAAGSVLALMAAFSFTASAQDRDRSMGRSGMQGGGADPCVGIECMPGRIGEPDRIGRPDGSDQTGRDRSNDGLRKKEVNRNDGNDGVDRKREARNDWKYDSNRHKRHRNKDARYRFYYGGYWYLEPYWDDQVYFSNRVSCGEGREIVDDSGFSRVRTIECSGRNFTYAARRGGDTFRVSINSRTGEIVGVRPM